MGEPVTSDLFEQYQSDYNALSAAISRRINSQIPSLTGEKKKEIIRTAERELDELEELLGSMDGELRTMPAAVRAKLQQRYKTFKTDVTQLRKDLKRVSTSGDRDELFAGAANDLDRASSDQRQKLLDNNARLDSSTKRLEESHRLALETEQVGVGVITSLKGQREQLENASKTLDEVDDTLGRSGRILKGMARRVVTNKIITVAIILVLLGIIGLIIYLAVK